MEDRGKDIIENSIHVIHFCPVKYKFSVWSFVQDSTYPVRLVPMCRWYYFSVGQLYAGLADLSKSTLRLEVAPEYCFYIGSGDAPGLRL